MLHAGIDLHKRTVAFSTVTAEGPSVRDAQRPTTRAAVRSYFAALPGPQRAVGESTSNWYGLRDLLASEGVELHLGHSHSNYIKAISYAKVKTDAVDAATLAQLLRSDLIPEAHMVSAEWREARDLLRARLPLVGQQTRCKNALQGLLAQYNVTTPAALPPLVQLRTQMPAEQHALLGTQAKQRAAALNPLLIPTPDVQRLPFYVLTKQEAFNGTFQGKPLSRTTSPKWPRLASPDVSLAPPAQQACSSVAFDWAASRRAAAQPLGPIPRS